MPRRAAALLAPLFLLLWPVPADAVEGALDPVACEITQGVPDLEVFTRPGCPHCADARVWLVDLQADHPELCVVVRDVVAEPAALADLATLSAQQGIGALSVPAFRVDDTLVVGFLDGETTGARLEALLADGGRLEAWSDEGLCPAEDPCADAVREVDLPWFGRVDTSALSGPAYYAWIGLYIAAYMADDALMVGLAVVTLSKRRLEETGGRRLKLVSGLVMGALGAVLLVRPEWLAF